MLHFPGFKYIHILLFSSFSLSLIFLSSLKLALFFRNGTSIPRKEKLEISPFLPRLIAVKRRRYSADHPKDRKIDILL